MLSRVMLVLFCRSLKFLPPLPMSQPICCCCTATRSTTNSHSSRAASTLACVGPVMMTRGPTGSISTRSTPVCFCTLRMCLPLLPTTRPMHSLLMPNSTRWPCDLTFFSRSSCSLEASCSRSCSRFWMSPWCLAWMSTSILAVAMAFSVPKSVMALALASRLMASSCDLGITSATTRASLSTHQASSPSVSLRVCLASGAEAGPLATTPRLKAGRMRRLSTIESPPARKRTLMKSSRISLTSASHHDGGSLSPSALTRTSTMAPCSMRTALCSGGSRRTSLLCTQLCVWRAGPASASSYCTRHLSCLTSSSWAR
mmetsp:Transcript_33963/g.80097  ORF Transcript_33963/g.80097 Transcript_33963/m.80097 type:complete len:314 (-) Transcript_33963:98-1039(-)